MQKYWGILVAIVLLASCKGEETTKIEVATIAAIEKPVTLAYGFNLDEFTVEQDTVRNGDSFGELMLQNKVDYPKIAKVSEQYKDHL